MGQPLLRASPGPCALGGGTRRQHSTVDSLEVRAVASGDESADCWPSRCYGKLHADEASLAMQATRWLKHSVFDFSEKQPHANWWLLITTLLTESAIAYCAKRDLAGRRLAVALGARSGQVRQDAHRLGWAASSETARGKQPAAWFAGNRGHNRTKRWATCNRLPVPGCKPRDERFSAIAATRAHLRRVEACTRRSRTRLITQRATARCTASRKERLVLEVRRSASDGATQMLDFVKPRPAVGGDVQADNFASHREWAELDARRTALPQGMS